MIYLEVGQAGCQVADVFFQVLEAESAGRRLRYPLAGYRQLVVDTERKTWRSRSRHNAGSLYDARARHFAADSRGRGNNWAMGYYGRDFQAPSGESETEAIMELYRRQMEGLDHYDGCMLVHSLSGGTGSGLGSRLAEEVRMEYGNFPVITTSIVPFGSGESPLQYYNCLLTLACLQGCADGIGLIPNDVAHGVLAKKRANPSTPPRIAMEDLNGHIALLMAGIYMPGAEVAPNDKQRGTAHPFQPWDLLINVTPLPACKFFQLASSVTETRAFRQFHDWNSIHSTLLQYLGPKPDGCTYAAQLTVRGCLDDQYWLGHRSMAQKLTARLGSPKWMALQVDTRPLDSTGSRIPELLHSMTLAHNGSGSADLIDSIARSSREKFEKRAFLHWYEKYGGPDITDVFSEAFETLDTALDFYRQYCGLET